MGFDIIILRIVKNGKSRPVNKRVNDIVALAWLSNTKNYTKTIHKDGNKQNNKMTNIKWIKGVVKIKFPQKSSLCRAVVQATLEGEFIAEYASMTEAYNLTGISQNKISAVCRGTQIQTAGFLWFYKEQFVEGKGTRKRVQCKKIRQYTKTGDFVAEFESIKEAAAAVGASPPNISAICLGKGKTCKGYIWKFVEIKRGKLENLIILKDYPNDKITKNGQIISIRNGKEKVQVIKQNYKAVRLINKDEKKVKIHVHLLVALAHVPNPHGYNYVKHVDGNILNNNFENLKWCELNPQNAVDLPREEDLKHIPGANKYYASKNGDIFSKKSGSLKKMKLNENISGYLSLILQIEKNGKKTPSTRLAHRLIAQAWLPNPKKLPVVNHKDGNKKNNCLTNLEWVTEKENCQHSRNVLKNSKYQKAVVQASLDGKFIKEFKSQTDAEKETGVSSRAICLVCQGKRRKAGEFTWFYKENFVEGKGMRKLKQCKKVRQYTKSGEFIKEFESVKEAAIEVGALDSNVSNACIGRTQTCKGYVWKFVAEEEKIDETEDWIILEDYPNDKISRDGRIYSTWVKRFKKQTSRKRYKLVSVVNKEKKEKKMYVHQLVALAYLPNPRGYKIVNHIDGNPSNNTVENLEWTNNHLNAQHAYDTGLNSCKKKVRQIDVDDGVVVGRFNSMAEAAEAVGVSESAISHCCREDMGLKTAGGYKWEYDT